MVIDFGLGIIIGTVLALTGAGGGILAVPLLVCVDGLSVIEAAPVSLIAISMAAAFGAIIGLKDGTVRYRAALFIAFTGMPASPLGFWMAGRVGNVWLGALFAGVLLIVACKCLFAKQDLPKTESGMAALPPCRVSLQSGRLIWTSRCAKSLAVSGAATGFLSGLVGVGGGFVIVPALKRFTELDMHSIVPTALASIAIVSMSGAVAGAAAGHVRWVTAIPFSIGALLGVIGVRQFAARLSGRQLQTLFAVAAVLAAFALLVKILA